MIKNQFFLTSKKLTNLFPGIPFCTNYTFRSSYGPKICSSACDPNIK